MRGTSEKGEKKWERAKGFREKLMKKRIERESVRPYSVYFRNALSFREKLMKKRIERLVAKKGDREAVITVSEKSS